MSITFSCSGCGKQFKAKAEYAGKPMKCPLCATVTRIPAPRTGAPVSAEAAEEVSCPHCGSSCRILAAWRGKTLACPSWTRQFCVPLESRPAATGRPLVQADTAFHTEDVAEPTGQFYSEDEVSGQANDYFDDADSSESVGEQYLASRQFKRDQSGFAAWLTSPIFWFAGAGVVALIVVVVIVAGVAVRGISDLAANTTKSIQANAAPLPDPLGYLPSYVAVTMVRVSQILDGRLDSLGPAKEEFLSMVDEAGSEGVELRDIEQMYLTGDGGAPRFIVAVSKRPFPPDRASSNPEACESYNDITIYETPDGFYRSYPHPRMVVQADDLEWLKLKLDSPQSSRGWSSLQFPADCQVATQYLGMGDLTPISMLSMRSATTQGFAPGNFRGPVMVQAGMMGLNFVSGRVDGRFDLQVPDASAAQDLASQIESGKAALRQSMAQRPAGSRMSVQDERMLHMLVNGTVSSSGSIITIRFTLNPTDLAQTNAGSQVPQRLPGQKKPKVPFVTVRVSGTFSDDEQKAIQDRLVALAGETSGHSRTGSSQPPAVLVRLMTSASPDDLAKRIDFGDVTRVKGRGIVVTSDSKRLAALPRSAESPSKSATHAVGKPADVAPGDHVGRALADLKSYDIAVRRKALEELAKQEPDDRRAEVVKAILTEMLDNNKSQSDAALKVLLHWGDRQSVPTAIEMLRARSTWDGTNLMKFLARYPDEQSADAIAERLTNSRDGKAAQEILREIGAAAETALVKVLRKGDVWAADPALDVLSSLFDAHQPAEETRDALIQFIKKDKSQNQHKAIIALGGIKDEVAAEAAAEQLGELGNREPAGQALRRMGPIAEKFVVPYLKHTTPFVREEACKVLALIGTKKSVPALQALSRDFFSGQAARQAIEAINQRSKQKQ